MSAATIKLYEGNYEKQKTAKALLIKIRRSK